MLITQKPFTLPSHFCFSYAKTEIHNSIAFPDNCIRMQLPS